jgi:hypothetical protein
MLTAGRTLSLPSSRGDCARRKPGRDQEKDHLRPGDLGYLVTIETKGTLHMAMSNAEKQRRWRERHVGDDKLRLQLVVDVAVIVQLRRLAEHRKVSVTVLIEDMARRAEGATVAKMSAAEDKRYYAEKPR